MRVVGALGKFFSAVLKNVLLSLRTSLLYLKKADSRNRKREVQKMDFEADYLMSVKTLYENMKSKVIGIILYFVYGEHQAIGYITFSCTPTLFISIILYLYFLFGPGP